MRSRVSSFENNSEYKTLLLRELNEWFYDVLSEDAITYYYDKGFTKNFFDTFKEPRVFFPAINSIAYLGVDVARELNEKQSKIFIYPSRKINIFKQGKVQCVDVKIEFWRSMIEQLQKNELSPVIYNDVFTHDFSQEFQDCIHVVSNNMSYALTAMRSCGLVLDCFSGIYKMAICARTPFLCFGERSKFNFMKEYEVDDLCAYNLMPKEYIFAFSTILTKGEESDWSALHISAINRAKKMIAVMDRDRLPPTVEQDKVVPYDIVRENKIKKLGTKFIKVKED